MRRTGVIQRHKSNVGRPIEHRRREAVLKDDYGIDVHVVSRVGQIEQRQDQSQIFVQKTEACRDQINRQRTRVS